MFEHIGLDRHSFVSSASRLFDLRRSNESEEVIVATMVIALGSEQQRSERWAAWTKGAEDFVGGLCEGTVDSRLFENFHVVKETTTATNAMIAITIGR